MKRNKIKSVLLPIAALSLGLAIAQLPNNAHAANVLYSGAHGDCNWTMDDETVLEITPSNGVSCTLTFGASYEWNWRNATAAWNYYSNNITEFRLGDGVNLGEDLNNLLSSAGKLTTVDASNWNTSAVKNMSNMFYSASSLKTLDVSNWDVSNVENMRSAFHYMESLESLDVSKWNTSKVENFFSTFSNTLKLASLDVSNWDTSSAENMRSMFANAQSLTSLDLSKWDTSSVKNMQSMFAST